MSRADAIVAELRADAALCLAVLEAVDVARVWEPQTHYLGPQHAQPTGDAWFRRSGRNPDRNLATANLRKDGRWDWWHLGKREGWPGQHDDAADTAEAAMRRADAGLDVCGVPRVGGAA